MKSTLLTLSVLASLISFGAAQDKEKKGTPPPYNAAEVVKKFDKNSDSKLSLEEYSAMAKWKKEKDPAAAAKTAFEKEDLNKDGNLDEAEIKAGHEARAKARESKKDEPKKDEAKKDAKPAVEVKPAVEAK